MMMRLAGWAQHIVTFRAGAPNCWLAWLGVQDCTSFLGMTIFLIFPFTRLVHVWSGFGSVGLYLPPYQVVRSRRLNLPAGHNQPRQPGASV
jgi:nitrate reductase gamma subunit